MRLRAQLLAVGLATLAVPVLGWQSVRQLHVSLQETRADAQTLSTANLRVALGANPAVVARLALGAVPAEPADWYAETARWPLFVDGYADDWQELAGATRRFAGRVRTEPLATGGKRAPASGAFGEGTDATLALRVARRADRLFLFVRVRDDTRVRHVPPRLPIDAGENERVDPETLRANGDALEVYVRAPDGTASHALLSVIAPGPIEVVRAVDRTWRGRRLPRWRAEWVDGADGYQVEVALPLPPVGSRVGVAAIDVGRAGGPRDAWVGTMSPRAMRAAADGVSGGDGEAGGEGDGDGGDDGAVGAVGGGRLFHEAPAARAALLPWVAPGTRARLHDRSGRLVADVDALYAPLPEGEEPPPSLAVGLLDAILFRLFAWFAAGDLPLFPETEKTRQPLALDASRRALADAGERPTTRYVTVDNDRVLGTLAPVAAAPQAAGAAGYLLFESNEEHASIATGSRLARLFALLLLASLAVGALLFAWATRLSLRIRRLSREAHRAIDADGRVGTLASSAARDEIGALSRDLSSLLARSAAYTRYLETLSSRLSHELGTPLSVVRTSLENVDRNLLDAETATLLARAGGGADRLGAIVRALVDSTRLEQSVQHASFAPLELRAWLDEAAAQYAQVHPGFRFTVTGSPDVPASAGVAGAADGGGGTGTPPDGIAADRARSAPRVRVRASATLLQQALDKLVANACDFATAPAIALVLARRGEGDRARVVLAVGNRGPAIGEANRERVFEPAFSSRASASDDRAKADAGEGHGDGPERDGGRSRGRAGAGAAAHGGLGLHLVRLIAEAHGGDAFVADRPDGVIVGLRLPVR